MADFPLLDITDKQPLQVEADVHMRRRGGPGWLVAVSTLVGVVSILLIAVYFLLAGRSATQGRAASASAEAAKQRDALRLSADCLFIFGRYNEKPQPCADVASRIGQLREDMNPFETTTTTTSPERPSSALPASTAHPAAPVSPVTSRDPPVTTTSTIAPPTTPPPCLVELLGIRLVC